MALDRPFDDGRVQTANVAVSASTVSENILVDLIFMFSSKPLYFRHFRPDETAEMEVSLLSRLVGNVGNIKVLN